LKIADKTYVATYDVEDNCVQVTHKGRRSIWTELGGAHPEDVAKALLKELLGVLVATLCFATAAEHTGTFGVGAVGMHPALESSSSAETLSPSDHIRLPLLHARRDL
jgi:hypothetical protein